MRFLGEVPEWSKGADCKSVGYAFEGSNPSLPIGLLERGDLFFHKNNFSKVSLMGRPFYSDGLKFECTRCSACCRFDPGFVFLSRNDLDRLLSFMSMKKDSFIRKYCRIVDMGNTRRLSLVEKENYDCIFWSENGCAVYEARPLQCRSYPFWRPFLESKEAWDAEAENCPGMNRGTVHSAKVIEKWLEKRDNETYRLEDIL